MAPTRPPSKAQLAGLEAEIKRRVAVDIDALPAAPPAVAHLDAQLQQQAASSKAATIDVTITGDLSRVRAAVARLHGHITATTASRIGATIPRTVLSALAASPGIAQVSKPVRGFIQTHCPMTGSCVCPLSCSEGVADSGATSWQTAGNTGIDINTHVGIKIGIVDGGFAGLAAEQAAHNLPATGSGIVYPHGQNRCANDQASEHGTAVAEIIHEMAPNATLVLECVDDQDGFQLAGAELTAAGVKIVNSSLGFPGDSRGDGSGDDSSTATTVATARKAGVLWIESAGNNAVDHWSGTLVDTNHDNLVDLAGTSLYNETDAFYVFPNGEASVVLQWDQWPVSSANLTLTATASAVCIADWDPLADPGPRCVAPTGSGPAACGGTWTCSATQSALTQPRLTLDISNTAATSPSTAAYLVEWDVNVVIRAGTAAVHYDLSYWGDVTASALACPTQINCIDPVARAVAGSITEPASSPFALAVGAVDASGANICQSDTSTTAGGYPLESYSSQGPTIDGRQKPDLVAFDGVTDPASKDATGPQPFCGTSAAAPHVAGAAALVLAADPTLDASQLEAYLEQHATGSGISQPLNPPTNALGHGVLNLGSLPIKSKPATSTYEPLTAPARALNTNNVLAANGGTLSVSMAGIVPPGATATAVAINLTVEQVTKAGFLAVYPTGIDYPGTSNLNYSPLDPICAVFAVVALNANQAITVRNAGAATAQAFVDIVGYFKDPTLDAIGVDHGTKYTPVALAQRILDTRRAGANFGRVTPGKTLTVATPPALHLTTGDSIVVNITAAGGQGSGSVHLDSTTPALPLTTSSLNYARYDRANLAIVAVGADGSFTVTGNGRGNPSANVIVDLLGTFTSAGVSSFVPLPAPVRIIDTRKGNGLRLAPLTAGNPPATFPAAGFGELPHSETITDPSTQHATTALLAAVVAVPPASGPGSYLTVYPGGATKPGVSTVNFSGGRAVPNAMFANLTGSETISIYNAVNGANVVVDVFGYFLS